MSRPAAAPLLYIYYVPILSPLDAKTSLILSGCFPGVPLTKKPRRDAKTGRKQDALRIALFRVGPISSNLRHTPSPHTFLPDYIASMSAQSSLQGRSAGLHGFVVPIDCAVTIPQERKNIKTSLQNAVDQLFEDIEFQLRKWNQFSECIPCLERG